MLLFTIVTGAYYEGVRLFQYFFIICFLVQSVLIIFDVYSLISLGIYMLVIIVYSVINFIYGDANFSEVIM